MGLKSRLNRALVTLKRPVAEYIAALRATRDGDTQSKVSAPASMAANRSSGSLIPSRCRGLSSGSSSVTQPTTPRRAGCAPSGLNFQFAREIPYQVDFADAVGGENRR